MGIGTTLMAAEGYTSPRFAEHCGRARELAIELDRPFELGAVMLGSGIAAILRGSLAEAHGYGLDLLDVAGRAGHNTTWTAAHFLLGMTTGHFGHLRQAGEHLNTCLDLLDREPPGSMIFGYGQHPRVVALGQLARIKSHMGLLDQAARAQDQSLQHARALDHPLTTAFALGFAAKRALILHGPDRALEISDELLALTAEHDFPYWRAYGLIDRGRALVEQGSVKEGMARLHEGREALQQGGGAIVEGSILLGEAYLIGGDVDEGLDIALSARSAMSEIREGAPDKPTGMFAPQAAILEGNLLAAKGEYTDAERYFNEAIDIAQLQESLHFELLATIGIARLRHAQERREEGLSALQAVYDRFTEGFDLLPLREARLVLEELRM